MTTHLTPAMMREMYDTAVNMNTDAATMWMMPGNSHVLDLAENDRPILMEE